VSVDVDSVDDAEDDWDAISTTDTQQKLQQGSGSGVQGQFARPSERRKLFLAPAAHTQSVLSLAGLSWFSAHLHVILAFFVEAAYYQ
jgi:hypothetical protein